MDVDGVLTDGTFWWGPNGEEWKRFSFVDVMGVSLGSKAGLVFGLISGEDSPQVERYARKMSIEEVYKGCKDKAAALRAFSERQDIPLARICFIGDDINDLPALAIAGFSAAPSNAHNAVRDRVSLVLDHAGGLGAVRELVDRILSGDLPAGRATTP